MTDQTVSECMIKGAIEVPGTCAIEDVLVKFHLAKVSCLLVCQGNKPIGLISERDLASVAFNLLCKRKETRRTAADIMTTTIVTVRPSDPMEKALALAAKNQARHVPVVDADGTLAGLLTETELIRSCLER